MPHPGLQYRSRSGLSVVSRQPRFYICHEVLAFSGVHRRHRLGPIMSLEEAAESLLASLPLARLTLEATKALSLYRVDTNSSLRLLAMGPWVGIRGEDWGAGVRSVLTLPDKSRKKCLNSAKKIPIIRCRNHKRREQIKNASLDSLPTASPGPIYYSAHVGTTVDKNRNGRGQTKPLPFGPRQGTPLQASRTPQCRPMGDCGWTSSWEQRQEGQATCRVAPVHRAFCEVESCWGPRDTFLAVGRLLQRMRKPQWQQGPQGLVSLGL